ncbi:unnamed protein product, partial [Prorocentrum cordatum]
TGDARRARLPRSGIAGVHSHRRKGRLLYRASIVAGPFRITTGFSASPDRAEQHLQILHSLRDRICAATGSAVEGGGYCRGVEARFRAAVATEPRPLGFGPGAPRLYFYASVPAGYWVGRPLTTPSFPVADGLEVGLQAWRRLSEARGAVFLGRTNRYTMLQHHDPAELDAAWIRLRQVHIDIWSEVGRCPRRLASRLRELESRRRSRMPSPSPAAVPLGRLAAAAILPWRRRRAGAAAGTAQHAARAPPAVEGRLGP